jgi:hypothetical protein
MLGIDSCAPEKVYIFGLGALPVLCTNRERWPLLTVETEENRDPKNTNEGGEFSLGLSCRIFVLPWLLLSAQSSETGRQ